MSNAKTDADKAAAAMARNAEARVRQDETDDARQTQRRRTVARR